MDFEALRALVVVGETGSFLGAAGALGWARPTLRRRIDELEAQAGVPLVTRSAEGVSLTEAGALLARRARVLIQESNAILSTVRELGSEPSGIVRIVLPVGLPPDLLLPVFTRLRTKYPKLALRIRFSDDPIAGLLDDVDVALYFGGRAAKGPWHTHEVLRVRERLLATPAYLASAPSIRSPQDLAEHPLLVWAQAPHVEGYLPLRTGGRLAISPALASTDIHLLRRFAHADFGVAYVPDAGLPGLDGPAAPLVPVLESQVGRERSVRLAVPEALSEIPRIKALVDEATLLAAAARGLL